MKHGWWYTRFMNNWVALAATAIWLAGVIIVTVHPELHPAATLVVVPTLIIAAIWHILQITFVKRWMSRLWRVPGRGQK